MKIGEKIHHERKKRNLSQEEFAALLKIDQTQLSRIEKYDAKISHIHLSNMCKALNMSADYFLGLIEEPQPIKKNNE